MSCAASSTTKMPVLPHIRSFATRSSLKNRKALNITVKSTSNAVRAAGDSRIFTSSSQTVVQSGSDTVYGARHSKDDPKRQENTDTDGWGSRKASWEQSHPNDRDYQ